MSLLHHLTDYYEHVVMVELFGNIDLIRFVAAIIQTRSRDFSI